MGSNAIMQFIPFKEGGMAGEEVEVFIIFSGAKLIVYYEPHPLMYIIHFGQFDAQECVSHSSFD